MRFCLNGLCCWILLAPAAWAAVSAAAIDHPFVVTQLPTSDPAPGDAVRSSRLLREDYGCGARLVVVDSAGNTRPLADSLQSACDPDVSFDGQRLLFAGKKTAGDPWAVYEIGVDGSGLRQVTREAMDCRSPSYQSQYYQISDANVAWYQITFVGSCPSQVDDAGNAAPTALYTCKPDGSAAQRLTFNVSSDYDPHLMADGRLVFASWQRRTLDRGPLGRVVLLDINLDGTDPAPLCVEHGRRIKHMPCGSAGGLIVFVEADSVPWDGAGMLSCVSTVRPLHTYRPITKPEDGLFHSPSPLPDGRVLVSRRSADGSETHGVCALDPATGRTEPWFDDPAYHDMQAKVIVPRAEPDGRSSPMIDTDPLGKLYCLNVYVNDFPDQRWLPPGAVHSLRLLEAVPSRGKGPDAADGRATAAASASRSAQAEEGTSQASPLPAVTDGSPAVIPTLAPRRILGEVPVAADGSFQVAVAANVPLELQLLDERGLTLRSCGWIGTRNHFNQGCIGCHEDPELTPENLMVDALESPSLVLNPPPAERRSIDFRRDLMPLVSQKCLPCHRAGGSPPDLSGGRAVTAAHAVDAKHEAAVAWQAYASLLRPSRELGGEGRGEFVDPGRARTSSLVWHLLGVNTSRPWDGEAVARQPKPIPAGAVPPLTAEEARRFAEWIDLGAPWAGAAER